MIKDPAKSNQKPKEILGDGQDKKAERIREVRKTFKLSQRDFSYRIDRSHALISQMEKQKAPILSGTLDSIAVVFGINREWLENGSGEMIRGQYNRYDDIEYWRRKCEDLETGLRDMTVMVTEMWLIIQKYIDNKSNPLEEKIVDEIRRNSKDEDS